MRASDALLYTNIAIPFVASLVEAIVSPDGVGGLGRDALVRGKAHDPDLDLLAPWVGAHDRAMEHSRVGSELPLDAAVKEELRALGYLE